MAGEFPRICLECMRGSCSIVCRRLTLQSKWQHQTQILEGRSLALRESGRALTVETEQCPHLVALSVDDPLATGIVLYYLHEGTTLLGLPNTTPLPDIELTGEGVTDSHCAIECDGGEHVLLRPLKGQCIVNGKLVVGEAELMQGQTLQLGQNNLFRFNHPIQVQSAEYEMAVSMVLCP